MNYREQKQQNSRTKTRVKFGYYHLLVIATLIVMFMVFAKVYLRF